MRWRDVIIWGAIPALTAAIWALAYIGGRFLLTGGCAL